jgi:heme/copper-type cytochrome/quinol oxidase subunit 3
MKPYPEAIKEAIARIEPARPTYPNVILGVILFLISEAFLFGALFWTYYYLRGHTPVWPPEGVELETGLALVNTFILLASSGTIWWAERSVRRSKREGLAAGLAFTMILGSIFLGITIYEWFHETFLPWGNAYGSIFYTLTGFHALHVFGGIMFMAALLVRTLKGHFTSEDFVPVQAGAYYWHFVDFIWIVVFITLFIVR